MSNIVHREIEIFMTVIIEVFLIGNLSVTLNTIQDQHSKPFKTKARWFGREVIRLAI